MPTAAIATKIFNVLRTRLSATNIEVRIKGKTLNALLASPSFEEKVTFWGDDEGYQASIYVLDADVPAQGIESGDEISVKDGSRWIDRRIVSIDTKSQTVKKLMVGNKFTGS